MDADTDDIVAGLENTVTLDGQTIPVHSLPMGGFTHTNVGNATARTNYAAAGQVQDSSFLWGATSGGSANAQTIALTPVITSYAGGQFFKFIAGFTNTGATTLNVNSVGAVAVKIGASALGSGDIQAGQIVCVVYDGTAFQLLVTQRRVAATTSFTSAGNVPVGPINQVLLLGGNAFYSLTIPAASGYPAGTTLFVANIDGWTSGRAKKLNFTGQTIDTTKVLLYPSNSATIVRDDATPQWLIMSPTRQKLPGTTVTFFFDPTNGSDTINTRDGLATYATDHSGPLASANATLWLVTGQFDWNTGGSTQTIVVVKNLASAVDTVNVHYAPHVAVGAQGGASVILDMNGGELAPTGATGLEVYFDTLRIQNGTFSAPTAGTASISALRGGKIDIATNVTLGTLTAAGSHILLAEDGQVIIESLINLAGGHASGFLINNGGGNLAVFPGGGFSLNNNVAYSALVNLGGGRTDLSQAAWVLNGHTLTAAVCQGTGANTFSRTGLYVGSLAGVTIGNWNAWSSYTPTITASAGTFTTVSAAGLYYQDGNTVKGEAIVTITNAGTASGAMIITIPTPNGSQSSIIATGICPQTGKSLVGFGPSGNGNFGVNNYDNTTCIATGNVIHVHFDYQGSIS